MSVSRKGKPNKTMRSGIIIFIIVILLASSTIVILFGSKNNTTAASESPVKDNTGLYAFFSSNNDTTSNVTLTWSNGMVFNYTAPGSDFYYSVIDTIDIAVLAINNQHRAMNYSILVYQAEIDNNSNTFNFTNLYYSPVNTMFDGDAYQYLVHVRPAYASNNSKIGVAICNGSSYNQSKMLNYTDITANIYGI
jgi:hypothetical protein